MECNLRRFIALSVLVGVAAPMAAPLQAFSEESPYSRRRNLENIDPNSFISGDPGTKKAPSKKEDAFFDERASSGSFFDERESDASSRDEATPPAAESAQVAPAVAPEVPANRPPPAAKKPAGGFGNAFGSREKSSTDGAARSDATTDASAANSAQVDALPPAPDLATGDQMLRTVTSVMDRLKGQLDKTENGAPSKDVNPLLRVPQEPLIEAPKDDRWDVAPPVKKSPREDSRIRAREGPTNAPVNQGDKSQSSEGMIETDAARSAQFSNLADSLIITSKTAPKRQGAVLSVIVNSKPSQHLTRVLDRLNFAAKNFRIPVGEIVVIGEAKELDTQYAAKVQIPPELFPMIEKTFRDNNIKDPIKPEEINRAIKNAATPAAKSLSALNVESRIFQKEEIEAIVKRYSPTVSPTWIVHTPTADHVFAGEYDVTEFFNVDGEFILGNDKR